MNVVRRRWLGVVGFVFGLLLVSAPNLSAESLTLDQCIDIALQRNVSVASARYSLERARQNVWSSWGNWLPQFRASAGYSYYEQSGASQYSFSSPITRTYSKSIRVDQNLFRWGGNWFDLKSSMSLRRAGEYDLSQTELETIERVKGYFFSSLKYQGLLEVAEQSVESARQNLELVQARFDLGSANQSELLKAKVQHLRNRAVLEGAKKNAAVGMAELNNVMNRPAKTALILNAGEDTLGVQIDYTQAMTHAREKHPKIQSAEAQLQAARYDKLSARSDYLPNVSWGATRSYSAGQTGDWGSFESSFANWSFGVSFSWPIPFFDGFSRKVNHSRVKEAYKLGQLNLESVINGVGLDVHRSLLGINNERANLRLYEESLRSAEEDIAIAQERYNLGAATVLDLLNAQENLAAASNEFVSAKYNFNLAVAALDKAMGRRR